MNKRFAEHADWSEECKLHLSEILVLAMESWLTFCCAADVD